MPRCDEQYVSRAPGDGYTVLVHSSGHALNPALYPNLKYDPAKSFAQVGIVNRQHEQTRASDVGRAQQVGLLLAEQPGEDGGRRVFSCFLRAHSNHVLNSSDTSDISTTRWSLRASTLRYKAFRLPRRMK